MRSRSSARHGRDVQAELRRTEAVNAAALLPDLDTRAAHAEAALAGVESAYRYLDRELAALGEACARAGLPPTSPDVLRVSARHTLAYRRVVELREEAAVLGAALARRVA